MFSNNDNPDHLYNIGDLPPEYFGENSGSTSTSVIPSAPIISDIPVIPTLPKTVIPEHNGRLYISRLSLQDKIKLEDSAEPITIDAFLKRIYVSPSNIHKDITREQLKNAVIQNGKVYLKNELIIRKQALQQERKNSKKVKIYGKELTFEAVLRWKFKFPGQKDFIDRTQLKEKLDIKEDQLPYIDNIELICVGNHGQMEFKKQIKSSAGKRKNDDDSKQPNAKKQKIEKVSAENPIYSQGSFGMTVFSPKQVIAVLQPSTTVKQEPSHSTNQKT